MPVTALTIDFWNTLVVARSNGEIRRRDRMACLAGVAGACNPRLSETEILRAFQEAEFQFGSIWERDHRTLGSDDLLRLVWKHLKIEVGEADHLEAVTRFEEGILTGPPTLTDGVRQALGEASERYRLAVISDTMFSPGRVIRRLLDREGILQYFSALVFSDETGYSKPDPRAFRRALQELGAAPEESVHIGDLRRTDVAGANRAGLRSVLYTGVHADRMADHVPHAELEHWSALREVISTFEDDTGANSGNSEASRLHNHGE